MKFGLQLPNFGPFSEVDRLLEMAQRAERAGWDGFFLWDHVAIPERMVEPMTVFAAIATVTGRIKFGPMITAPTRRRPWKLARECVTLDHLSGGRLILGVGLGASEYDFEHVGEVSDYRLRAGRTDEALAILDGLWRGEPFSFAGEHFQVDDLHFLPRPVQSPRIPIWVAGLWDNKPPMRRASRWDGAFPIGDGYTLSPEDWREVVTFVNEQRSTTGNTGAFDFVHSGITPNDPEEARAIVAPYADAGVTWWLEDISPVRVGWKLGDTWHEPWDVEQIVARIDDGPPVV